MELAQAKSGVKGCPKSLDGGQPRMTDRRLAESGDYGSRFDGVFGQTVEGTLGRART